MMLVHKQPPVHLPQHLNSTLNHRRHPSAPPTLIVQPTHTPGLLSLSKPTHNPSPQRPPQHKSPRPRQQQSARPALLNAAEITDKKNAVRPKKQQKPSDSAKSTPPRHGKHRQPSPPTPDHPSQAEDPFLDSSSTTFKPSIPRPKQPSRRPNNNSRPALSVQTPSKPVPVPANHRPTKSQQLSRSAPIVSHSWDHMCDDSNDESTFTPPTTPLRARPSMIASFNGPVAETHKRKARNHKRAPSDHIFAMSSDDEAASGQEDLRALLNFVRSGSAGPMVTSTPPPQRLDVRSLSPASREKFFEREAQKEVAGYFASSSFQNSPSPDDLPDPLFA
ncbi:hypothetical protein D9756_006654 [Leucocoprinus leucothites]|uniref:Uncharacterized protein n=1 Tax=Leucocoprinus leucothites TaxID=201217 RepID=A0A8H5G279_9AGAR|nr:hypothetical protein D9756_006654 [Leucoagaricus leucothites]